MLKQKPDTVDSHAMTATALSRDEVMIKHEETSGGDCVRYIADAGDVDPMATTLRWFTIAKSDLVAAAFVAQSWHGGQFSALYKLTCGDFSYETLRESERELVRALQRANVSSEEWVEAQSALDTLQRVTSHFDV